MVFVGYSLNLKAHSPVLMDFRAVLKDQRPVLTGYRPVQVVYRAVLVHGGLKSGLNSL